VSWCVLPWVYSVCDSLGFLDLDDNFFPHFREVFNYYLLKYFLMVFLFVFFFWDSYDSNVGVFNIVPEVSEVVLISFNSFFLSVSFISTILSLVPYRWRSLEATVRIRLKMKGKRLKSKS